MYGAGGKGILTLGVFDCFLFVFFCFLLKQENNFEETKWFVGGFAFCLSFH